ncbi:Protein FAM53A [Camelus dromedarius]|uniref:Protein FAM53A n=1 Tax=Camelus dromedarius TaxID=9838 RepID=A0A5N4EEW7_CAMDR|nr:Protein FAM53A [Camelus dromedarius]
MQTESGCTVLLTEPSALPFLTGLVVLMRLSFLLQSSCQAPDDPCATKTFWCLVTADFACIFVGRAGSPGTLKNSKSLCSLDYEDEDEDDARVKTAVSSPRDPHGLQPRPAGLSPRASPEWVAAEGEGWSGGDPSDWDSAGEEGAFPLDRSRELDLEQIENN